MPNVIGALTFVQNTTKVAFTYYLSLDKASQQPTHFLLSPWLLKFSSLLSVPKYVFCYPRPSAFGMHRVFWPLERILRGSYNFFLKTGDNVISNAITSIATPAPSHLQLPSLYLFGKISSKLPRRSVTLGSRILWVSVPQFHSTATTFQYALKVSL